MENDLTWRRRVLPNGSKILFYPRKSALTTQIGVAITYGANMDSDLKSGRAHFLEHMLCGGSDKRIDLSRQIEHLGGIINFSTNHEYTYSFVDVVPEKMHEATKILSKLLFDPYFEQEKFDLERKIIHSELSTIFDNPCEKIEQMLMNCLFKTHPIRREIIGSKKSLHSLALNDLVEAHNLYYNLSNMIIVVTGRFLEKDLDLITNNLLSNSPHSISIEKQRFLENSKPVLRNSKFKSGLNQTYLSMGARTVSSQHSEAHVLDLIATILGDGFSSRLFVEIREKLGLSYNISASSQCGLDYGYFSIDCSVKPKNFELTIKLIEREVNKLCSEKVVEKELKKAKAMIRGELLRLVDRSIDFPELMVACELKYKTKYAILNYLKKIGDTSFEDIIDVANKYIQSDKLSLVSLSPKEEK